MPRPGSPRESPPEPQAPRSPGGTAGPTPPSVDPAEVAAQLLRALRGRRSQVALSRYLGYRSNVVHAWEAGRRFPTAARFLAVARRLKREPRDAVARFYGHSPAWMARHDPASAQGVAALLDDLRGQRSIAELARAAGYTRPQVSRWLAGRTQPRLPELLAMVDATSLRLSDFVAELVDPERVPALAPRWRALEASRRVAREAPWAHAVLRALELEAYRRLPAHEPGWIAARLRLPPDAEAQSLALLEAAGQVRFEAGRFVPVEPMTVETRRDTDAQLQLRRWSAELGLSRMQDGTGLFSHNLFAVSQADLARLRELQRAYFRELRAIVGASTPAERVVVTNLQLFALDAEPT